MTSLGQTVAALAQARRRVSRPTEPGSGVLREVEGFAPNPGALRMRVHMPDRLPPKAPLVVVLHGCGQSAEGYAAGAGWIALADRFGFALLCPEQTRANNPNLCFNWFEPSDTVRDGGEAASIRQMVRRAVADGDLDSGRVFITGLSAGAAMAAAMLATYPEVFAAGALIAGLPYGAARGMQEAFGAMMQPADRTAAEWGDRVRAASAHRGPWPRVSIWHGDADTTVRPAAAEGLVRQWTDVHGLTGASPVRTRSAEGRPYLAWVSEEGVQCVELHRIPGMTHGTPLAASGPDGVGVAGPFLLEVGVSSSLEIARTWGLTAPSRTTSAASPTRMERPPSAAPSPHAVNPVRTARPSPKLDPTSVITSALRSAGLLK